MPSICPLHSMRRRPYARSLPKLWQWLPHGKQPISSLSLSRPFHPKTAVYECPREETFLLRIFTITANNYLTTDFHKTLPSHNSLAQQTSIHNSFAHQTSIHASLAQQTSIHSSFLQQTSISLLKEVSQESFVFISTVGMDGSQITNDHHLVLAYLLCLMFPFMCTSNHYHHHSPSIPSISWAESGAGP